MSTLNYANWEKILSDCNCRTETTLPTVLFVGNSGVGKSTVIAGLACLQYQEAMGLLSGGVEGNAAACTTKVVIVPQQETAHIFLLSIKAWKTFEGAYRNI